MEVADEQQDRYDKWAIRRIIDGKTCHFYSNLRCIPSLDKSCKSCYQKEASTVEGVSVHVE